VSQDNKNTIKGKIHTPLLNQIMMLSLTYKPQLKQMLKELNEECPLEEDRN